LVSIIIIGSIHILRDKTTDSPMPLGRSSKMITYNKTGQRRNVIKITQNILTDNYMLVIELCFKYELYRHQRCILPSVRSRVWYVHLLFQIKLMCFKSPLNELVGHQILIISKDTTCLQCSYKFSGSNTAADTSAIQCQILSAHLWH
jgi:hypothetical protein